MAEAVSPPVFEAILRPHRSLSRRGVWVVIALMLGGSAWVSSLMFLLGALPVIGFNVAEMGLAIYLFRLNIRAARASEIILLTESALTVSRTDLKGRRREVSFEPYFLSATLEERRGSVPVLALTGRGVRHVIGASLGDAEKRDLAQALAAALRRWRTPRFDNPQLRD
ncbi:MAG TPA: DUF2244 domain-containing protein [Acetobacteraceae bacterium]|nr:DUF2244 domain-containing protein [Acetobacteraceae bacterium]